MTHRSPVTTVACSTFVRFFYPVRRCIKDLLPCRHPSADEIAQQVYFVNHFYAVKNYGITKKDRAITVLVNKAAGETPTTITLERFLNNDYDDGRSTRWTSQSSVPENSGAPAC